jgi:predicted RNase H-like nuclease (RuvC/YqgF family)
MSDPQITELITAIKESDRHTRGEIQQMQGAIQEMAKNFSAYWQHLAVYEEDKKHDDEFKREVREHIKEARPLLEYVKEQKATTGKMKTAFFIAVMFAVLTAIGFSFK